MTKVSDTAKERLLSAAVELFARQGYGATTTRQIAKAAGSSISMLNMHFGSKENLYRKALERVIEVFAAQNISLFGEILLARQEGIADRVQIWQFIERLTVLLVEITRDPDYRYEVLLLNRELQDWENGFPYVEPILLFFYNYALLFEAYTGAPEGSLWAKELSFSTITGMFRDACYPALRSHLLQLPEDADTADGAQMAKQYHLRAIRGVLSCHMAEG